MFSFPESFEWLPPWIALPDDYSMLVPFSIPDDIRLIAGRTAIVEELRREMPQSHPLFHMQLDAIAVNVEYGYHDFVFATNSPTQPIATAHLTYSVETDPNWPRCNLFENLDAWQREMKLDHEHAGKPALDCADGHYRLISRQVENEQIWQCGRCGLRDALPNRPNGE